jgi:hypothetical protein
MRQIHPAETDRCNALSNELWRLLRRSDDRLARHLMALKMSPNDLTMQWFASYFSCLRVDQVERIWDLMILVFSDYLVYVALAMLLSFR